MYGKTGKSAKCIQCATGAGLAPYGKSYLCPIEARPEAAKETLISMASVYRQLAAATAGRKLLVIDAARGATEGQSGTVQKFLESLKPPPGIAIGAGITEVEAYEQVDFEAELTGKLKGP